MNLRGTKKTFRPKPHEYQSTKMTWQNTDARHIFWPFNGPSWGMTPARSQSVVTMFNCLWNTRRRSIRKYFFTGLRWVKLKHIGQVESRRKAFLNTCNFGGSQRSLYMELWPQWPMYKAIYKGPVRSRGPPCMKPPQLGTNHIGRRFVLSPPPPSTFSQSFAARDTPTETKIAVKIKTKPILGEVKSKKKTVSIPYHQQIFQGMPSKAAKGW